MTSKVGQFIHEHVSARYVFLHDLLGGFVDIFYFYLDPGTQKCYKSIRLQGGVEMFEKLNAYICGYLRRAIDARELDALVTIFNNITEIGFFGEAGLGPRLGIPEPRDRNDLCFYKKVAEHPDTFPLTKERLENVLRVYEAA